MLSIGNYWFYGRRSLMIALLLLGQKTSGSSICWNNGWNKRIKITSPSLKSKNRWFEKRQWKYKKWYKKADKELIVKLEEKFKNLEYENR